MCLLVIDSFEVVGPHCSFYAPDGTVDANALGRLVGDRAARLVGWFRFRRDLPLKHSLRDAQVHSSLMAHCGESELLCGLLTMSPRDAGATWSLDYAFSTEAGGLHKRVQLETENLSQGTSMAAMPAALARHSSRLQPLYDLESWLCGC